MAYGYLKEGTLEIVKWLSEVVYETNRSSKDGTISNSPSYGYYDPHTIKIG